MRFEVKEGTTSKFWEIELAGKALVVRWGRIGTKGQQKRHKLSSPAAAQKAHDKLVAAKRKKGYAEVGAKAGRAASPPVGNARNPELEATIRADRSQPGAYEVYADWLQGQGDPLGELIVLQCAGKTKAAQHRIAALGLPKSDVATFGWRFGLWQWMRLETEWASDYDEAKRPDPVGIIGPLFAMPMCCALEELRLGMLRWDDNHKDVPRVLREAGKHAWARELLRLHLGDLDGNIDTAHHRVGDVGKVITRTFPKLVWLKIHSGQQGAKSFGLDGLALPELTELVIETCSLSKLRLQHVLAAKLPALEKLELWFGSKNYGADCTVAQLRRLLDGKLFPNVVDLGLRNAEFADAIAEALPRAAIARRLRTLDLSMGTLTDAGARALAAGAKAFAKLERLVVDDNFVSKAAVRELRAALPAVDVVSKKQKDEDRSVAGEVHYFVSVSE